MAEQGRTEYAEDQRPCIVARKACGCYVAACGMDEEELVEIAEWDMDAIDLPAIVGFLREPRKGVTFEFRPVAFVRAGGLNFGCKHKITEAANERG